MLVIAAWMEFYNHGRRVQALTRALEILNVLAKHGERMSLTELARATKLAPSTAHRLLTTLQQDRFVQFESGPGALAGRRDGYRPA